MAALDSAFEKPLSPMWAGSVVVAAVLAVALGAVAGFLTVRSLRPIGEGELLSSDAAYASSRLLQATETDLEPVVRHIRNSLEIEGVGVLEADGSISARTWGSAAPFTVNPVLTSALDRGVFAAVASPLAFPVHIDGVREWDAGNVLYQVVQPLGDGRGLLLLYDVSGMLERRADATRVSPVVIPATIGSVLLFVLGGVLWAARSRADQRRRELLLEADFHRRRSAELQRHNRELESARAETQRALELAEEKNRIRSEFVLMINHELRTPLTGVVTGARLLSSSERLTGPERTVLEDVLAEGERLDTLIAQMLAVARVENRGLAADPRPQPLAGILERLASVRRKVPLDVDASIRSRSLVVSTDATTLAQLVSSLVDNAFTHGARHVRVRCTESAPTPADLVVGEPVSEAVYISISDDGPGIDHAFLPRAFEKFEKHSFSSGTGLGLYMARMMAEAIGSSISVRTSPAGTTMVLAIPLVTTLEPAA